MTYLQIKHWIAGHDSQWKTRSQEDLQAACKLYWCMRQCCINWLYFTHLEASEILHTLHKGVLWQWQGSLLRRTEGCGPRARVSRGGRVGKKRWRRTRTHFQLFFVTPRSFKIRALRTPGDSTRRQRRRLPLCLGVQRASPHSTSASTSCVQPPDQALHGPPGLNPFLGGTRQWAASGGPPSHRNKKLTAGGVKPSSALLAASQNQTQAVTITQTFPSTPISYHIREVWGVRGS